MAHARFREWLESEGWTQEVAAVFLGCSQSAVSAIAHGTRRPGVDLVHKIEELSAKWPKGPIKTEEWVSEPTPEEKRRRTKTAA